MIVSGKSQMLIQCSENVSRDLTRPWIFDRKSVAAGSYKRPKFRPQSRCKKHETRSNNNLQIALSHRIVILYTQDRKIQFFTRSCSREYRYLCSRANFIRHRCRGRSACDEGVLDPHPGSSSPAPYPIGLQPSPFSSAEIVDGLSILSNTRIIQRLELD